MPASVYIESSVISYLTARPSRDVVTAARLAITLDWWQNQRPKYEVYISALVKEEISSGDPIAAQGNRMKAKTPSFRHGSPESRLQGCHKPLSVRRVCPPWTMDSAIPERNDVGFPLFFDCELLHAIALHSTPIKPRQPALGEYFIGALAFGDGSVMRRGVEQGIFVSRPQGFQCLAQGDIGGRD